MGIFYYKSKIGILKIEFQNESIISLRIVDEFKNSIDTEFTQKIKTQLDEYFSGKRTTFTIKVLPKGTDFQKSVWNKLLSIPYGITMTYSELALATGHSNAQRAVGHACNKNPIIIIIPCHRIISKNGDITKYAYGQNIKEKLLKLENAI